MAGAGAAFPQYAGRKAPGWLLTERVLGAFRLSPEGRGRRAYAGCLEERAKDREGSLTDSSLKALRRGCSLGDASFRDRVLNAMADGLRPKRRGGSVTGQAARAHDKPEAERFARLAAAELGMPLHPAELKGRGVHRDGKALIAWLVRKRTSAPNAWVAERLAMGHPTSVSRASGRVGKEKVLAVAGRKLEDANALKVTDW